jgi:hypothetical protein
MVSPAYGECPSDPQDDDRSAAMEPIGQYHAPLSTLFTATFGSKRFVPDSTVIEDRIETDLEPPLFPQSIPPV